MSWFTARGACFADLGRRYGLALLVIVVAALLRWLLQPVMGLAPPYITFYLAIVVAAAIGGVGPGLLATAAGALMGVALAVPPAGNLSLGDPAEQVRLAIYCISGIGISLIAGAMHRARRRADAETARLNRTLESMREHTAERRRAEQALQVSEDRYRDLVENSRDLICTYELDGRLLSVNPWAARLLGYEPGEMLQRNIREFIAPEVRHEFDAHLASIRATGLATGLMLVQTHAGDKRVWEYTSTLRSGALPSPIIRGMAHDLTDRLKVEKELRKSEALLRIALTAGRAGAWAWDLKKNSLQWSDEYYRMLGFEPGTVEPSAEAASARIHPEDRARVDALVRSAIETGEPIDEVHRVRMPDDSVRWVRGISRVFHDGHKHATQMAGIAIDMTQYVQTTDELRQATDQLRRANERLVQADRSKDEFIAVLSHELRNPLMPIKHGLYILERAAPGGEQERDAKATIARQVDQITRLVNDLLEVNRISRGKVTLKCHRFDLREVVSRTLEDHRTLFVARGIRIHDEQPGQPVWINGDASRISQVFGNLLHNAGKFTHEGGEVSIVLQQQEAQAILRIRDTGVGICADLLGRIFEPFTQAEQKLDRSAGGLGLGLALVKGLVELHGGAVEACSEGEGKGAELTVRLPVEGDSIPAERPQLMRVEPRPRRVLVIEDNVDNADTLSQVLKFDGHEVAVAYSGPDGIETARLFKPDVVLCDIGLPGMNGYEVACAFRQDRALDRIDLVALTGYASAEDRDKAVAAGFDRHLVKPPSHDELERILSELPHRRAA